MGLSNQEQLDDELEGEQEIVRIRKLMETLPPDKRKFYEDFLKLNRKVVAALKAESETG